MKLTRGQLHEQVYFYTLIFLAISLPLSVFTTSLFQIVLAVNWFAEGRFREKWRRFSSNRALWLLLSLYLLHLIGVLWSDDTAYWLHDMKIKLPLFILPLVVATSQPLPTRQLNRVMRFFVIGVAAASLASVAKLLGGLPGEVEGYRDLSLFMSHIRFSLMIVLALLVIVYSLFVRRNSLSRTEQFFYLAALIWLPLFLVILKSLSGIVIGALLAFFILLRVVFGIRDPVVRFMVMVPVMLMPLLSFLYLGNAIDRFYTVDRIDPLELDAYTVEGKPYRNNTDLKEIENGHYVWLYVCDEELESEWNSVSEIDFHGLTSNGNSLRGTLIRFLTSKGLRKDAAGIRQLSKEEITAIEHGTANYLYMKRFGLYPRIYEVIWEIDRYRMGYDPNEKSVVQRYLYLEAGWGIAREHLLLGVGNGDVKSAFESYYESSDSPLNEKWRLRAHNQYLTFLISFGIPGAILCIIGLVGPLYMTGRQRSFLAAGFMLLVLLSMLNEDTLETAAGAAFVGFFYSLFIFGPDAPWLRKKNVDDKV